MKLSCLIVCLETMYESKDQIPRSRHLPSRSVRLHARSIPRGSGATFPYQWFSSPYGLAFRLEGGEQTQRERGRVIMLEFMAQHRLLTVLWLLMWLGGGL